MHYQSTRNPKLLKSPSAAILDGIARDGGLYTPTEIPLLKHGELAVLRTMPYKERAAWLLSHYLSDYTPNELDDFTAKAYSKFDTTSVAPLSEYGDEIYILELFHGPTCAFKDLALSILPYLMTSAMAKNDTDDNVCILVATSGDTGKAALEGFADVPGTNIIVFYPDDGVSEIQKLQMITQSGGNVGVCAVKGNFDDTQTGVKNIFSNPEFSGRLLEKNIRLSSANSINWGRLVPQIIYYVSAYCDLLNEGKIKCGDQINVCVPTGNFGNILAAYYAKEMGLPIDRLICASNANNVLTEFIETGVYNARRSFYKTLSPSMDILVSSNVERLLFELTRHDGEVSARCMKYLAEEGGYELSDKTKKELKAFFSAGWSDDSETLSQIKKSFEEYGYLPDTHTAVALSVLEKYRKQTGDMKKTVVASTASPFKFAPDVLYALTGKRFGCGTECLQRLSEFASLPVPEPLKNLSEREKRFTGSVEKCEMPSTVLKLLGIA
jgi:threonine synthase